MAGLQINFVNVGQGDCTLIICPDNTRIMIDCGAHHGALGLECLNLRKAKNATDDDLKRLKNLKLRLRPANYAKQLQQATKAASTAKTLYEAQKNTDGDTTETAFQAALAAFLGPTKKIDYLILTHHDADHFNKVIYLTNNAITFGDIYYSGPIAKYKAVRSNYYPPTLVQDYISITINGAAQKDQTMIENDSSVTTICQTKKLTIYQKASQKLAVDILASNVQSNTGDDGTDVKSFHFGGEDINGRSIITMITYKNDKILVMGDATTITEDYLVTTYGAALQSDTLRVGHHGSDSSSSQTFIDTVKPVMAIISGAISNNYALPTETITDRYIAYFKKAKVANVDKHELVCYAAWSDVESNIVQPLWQTWSLEETLITYSGT